MNKARLKSIMTLHGDTNRDVAEMLGISEQSFSCKINENGTEFKQGEITKIKDKYNLSPIEVDAIFFDLKVSKTDTKKGEG
jgi:hypothetical protein